MQLHLTFDELTDLLGLMPAGADRMQLKAAAFHLVCGGSRRTGVIALQVELTEGRYDFGGLNCHAAHARELIRRGSGELRYGYATAPDGKRYQHCWIRNSYGDVEDLFRWSDHTDFGKRLILEGEQLTSLPLCAYYEANDISIETVSQYPHNSGEGPLFFFVPVADGAAVRVPVCHVHCDILSEQFDPNKRRDEALTSAQLIDRIPEFVDANFPKNDTAASGGEATPGRGEAVVLLTRFILETFDPGRDTELRKQES